MTRFILKSLTICLLLMFKSAHSQEVWRESFSVPGKGIVAGGNGTVKSDFSGIDSWSLEYPSVELLDSNDYAMTVTTSGGRFEARDINGEVTWRSEWITIKDSENIVVELISAETGSGTNTTTKYMNVFYRLDNGEEVPFSINGASAGDWGTLTARQEGIIGDRLQIVCYLSTYYAADKVILDEVVVRNEPIISPPVNPFDVVINELMTDPYPPQGLPDVEYIELYNTSDLPVSTGNLELHVNGIAKQLQQGIIDPHGYLLLCATGSLENLKPYGVVCNVVGFQGLLNSGAVVEIINKEGGVIDKIVYSDSWLGDDEKKNGGWSLERIDPLRTCNQPGNWHASIHPEGGTPGSRNSVFAENRDVNAPSVKWAVAASERVIEVVFSEPIDTFTLTDASCYKVPELGTPDRIEKLNEGKVFIHFPKDMEEGRIYNLSISGIADECGNTLTDSQIDIQRNSIEPGDLLISEILFNPFPGGEDYIEIYNTSEKLIDLSHLMIASRKNEKELNPICNLTAERRILFPKEYLVLTRDTNAVFPWYLIQCPDCFLQMNSFPAYPNEEGCAVLLNEGMTVIDEFCYHEDMHAPFLFDVDGVSLERVSFLEPAGKTGNWHSAAANAGYGTPGYENSQAADEVTDKPVIVFEHEAFSPNWDGYNDEYKIHYQFGVPGFIANLKVYDTGGRFIRHLLKNESLGTSGTITWNGEDETGQQLPVGVYVVMLELFNAKGEVYRFKDGVVLTDLVK